MTKSRGTRTALSMMGAVWVACLMTACAVGYGEGSITGSVTFQDCAIDNEALDVRPSFFSAQLTSERMSLRIQRGSQLESYSDGITIFVRDVNYIDQFQLGVPIPLSALTESPVQLTLFMNASCPTGFPDYFRQTPAVLDAVSGTITFTSIYAPDVDNGQFEIAARFENVHLESPERPDERYADIEGWFSFFYQRGTPAQRFP